MPPDTADLPPPVTREQAVAEAKARGAEVAAGAVLPLALQLEGVGGGVGGLALECLGEVDTRAGYCTPNQLWPVGLQCAWQVCVGGGWVAGWVGGGWQVGCVAAWGGWQVDCACGWGVACDALGVCVHPAPRTPHPAHHAPRTPHPAPCTLHPVPYTLWHEHTGGVCGEAGWSVGLCERGGGWGAGATLQGVTLQARWVGLRGSSSSSSSSSPIV